MPAPPIELLDRSVILHSGHESPLHSQVRQALRGAIEAHFEDGQQFWTEGALMEKLGVSRITVRRALEDLQRQGMLNRHRAKGSFVCKSGSVETSSPTQARPVPHLGILAPHTNSQFLAALLEQLGVASTGQKQHFTIHLSERGQPIGEMLQQLEYGADAESLVMIGTPFDIAQNLYDALRERNYRVVCVDSPARNAPFVGVDNEAGIRIGLQHLRDLGHSRIAYIANEPSQHPNIAERIRAVERLGKEWQLEVRVFDPAIRIWQDSYEATFRVMEEVVAWKPTALFTASDTGAWAAIKWLREHDIAVPKQISVLGFDDEQPNAYTFPTCSSVAIPTDTIAKRTLELLNSPDLHTAFWPQRVLVTPTLVVRESTGAAPDEPLGEAIAPQVLSHSQV